jgi:O-succinylbenzoic acid--CoA ligase
LACLPLAHVGGLSVVTRAVLTGTALTVLPGFDAGAVDAAPAAGATLVSLVPAALARIDATRWRVVLLGGSAMPAGLPANAVRTYGMTETGSGVVYDGRPLEGAEVRVEDGELAVRGPMLLRAYRTRFVAGQDVSPDGVDPRTPEGWFRTGDAGAVADDGTVSVRGRIGDVIVTGGEKVWPEPVERILAGVPGVADIAVTGRDDPRWGQRVVALVVPTDPALPPPLDGLRAAVREHLAPWAAPRELVLVEALPRTALGKVRRADLARLLEP